MGALAGLFFLGLLFLGSHDSGPKCPSPRKEVWDKRETMISADFVLETGEVIRKESVGLELRGPNGTSTVKNMKVEMIKTGEWVDEEASEYNKRVRECQTINGEF